MNTVYVKLRTRDKNKYRKMLSTDETIFAELIDYVNSDISYTPGTLIEDGEWFKMENASQQPYAIDIITLDVESVDFDSLSKSDFKKIDYIFVKNESITYFQNVSKSKLVSKRKLGSFGDGFRYQSNCEKIVVNEYPDAIYCGDTDTLYFRKLEPIVGIFRGIDQLYREATDAETEEFLQNDFIALQNDYGTSKVKTANRKRIALATKMSGGTLVEAQTAR